MTSPGGKPSGLVPLGRHDIFAYPLNKEDPMSPVWIDARGVEHQLLIAEETITVPDPYLGFDRQIIAGQPVPPELEEGYKQAGSKKKPASSPARKSASAGAGSGDE